ncbi:transposase-like zinc-binding domain-containing protein [Spiroplasma endosymbiont of Amphimallon solstitiale]|uniref:transposase-like zinc-binding domain-containing protein n=1 Tax=Spiroplasma endosymbiont of Amphimallon solstitiale TaxID=3066288 RepID=UPI00313DD8A4
MNKNTVKEILNNLSDKDFIEIFRENKTRIKQIEKKEKFEAVEQKFKEKGIQCPDCSSFLCTKYGSKDYKQRYKCKSCNITFHAFKNHYFYWSHLSHDQWDLLIQIATLSQSAYIISQFINTTNKTFNYVEKYGWPKIIHQFTLKILFLIKNLLKVTLFSVKIL